MYYSNNNFNDFKSSSDKEVEKKTWSLAFKLILLTFLVIGLLFVGYLVYQKFYPQNKQKDIQEIEKLLSEKENDKKLEELLKAPEDSKNKKQNQIHKASCFINGKEIKDGEKIKLYSRRVVNIYDNCENYSQERECDNGILDGDPTFRFLTCDKNMDCQLPDGTVIKNNTYIKLYSKKNVPLGDNCEKYAQIRTCKDTILTGSKDYIYPECKVSYDNACQLPDGNILANNQTHTFYEVDKVPFGDRCIKHSKKLTCVDTNLVGGDYSKYKYWSCQELPPKNCYIDGIMIPHGESRRLFSKEYGTKEHNCDFFAQIRTCYNGKLDGDEEYNHAKCYDN